MLQGIVISFHKYQNDSEYIVTIYLFKDLWMELSSVHDFISTTV